MAKESSLKKIAKAVRNLRGKREPAKKVALGSKYSLEQLVALTKRKSLALEERIPRSEILMKRNEVLYRLDPLVWAGVNKITRLVASPKVFFTGKSEDDVVIMEMFVDRIGFKTILPFMIKDIFIYGYGVAEVIREKKKITRLAQIDPKTFDYQRVEGSEYIARNSDGSIKGYVQTITGHESKKFKPEDVVLLKLYVLGEECLGLTPLEPVYKSAWIKLNLEEALGEAVYRHGYPIYYYRLGSSEALEKGFEVTPDKVKEAKEYLEDLSTASELVLPWWITPGRLDAKSQIGDISDFLQYLSAEIMAGLEVPKVYGTTTQNIQANVNQETMDFEKTIKTMQAVLMNQVNEQLFSQYRKEVKLEYPYPNLRFTEYSEETMMFKSRRLAQYAKYNLLTADDIMEDDIRKLEGLSPRMKVKPSETCVFGMGSCPVRKTSKVPLEKLAKFCASCNKNRKGDKALVDVEEEVDVVEEEVPGEEV